MPRTVAEAKLENRAVRAKLPLGKMHWRTLDPGRLHLGYTRKRKDHNGQWKTRRYKGGERYQIAPLGLADDLQDAGPGILSYAQAARTALSYQWEASAPRQRPGGPTIEDVIGGYLAWLKVHRASWRDAETRARVWILPKLGHRRVADLRTTDIDRWLAWLAEQPALLRGGHQKARATDPEGQRARKATANRTFTILKAALNKAWRDGLVADDSAWRRTRPFAGTSAARPGFLSVAEAQRLVNAADPASGFRDLVHAALHTGCRYGELCALKVRDLTGSKLHVARSKNKGRPRDVTLSDEGAAFFAALAVGKPKDAVLLPRHTRNGSGPWNRSEQYLPMREACRRASITPAIGIHQMRHTYASLSVMAGMPLPVLAANLGHVDTRQIERHYAHLRDDYRDAEIKKHAPQFGLVRESNIKALAK